MRRARGMLTIANVLLCLATCGTSATILIDDSHAEEAPSYMPPKGLVPDADTALRIAEAVLTPIYGKRSVAREKPLVASLEGDVWTVRGTLEQGKLGGTALVQISKTDARVLRVSHGK